MGPKLKGRRMRRRSKSISKSKSKKKKKGKGRKRQHRHSMDIGALVREMEQEADKEEEEEHKVNSDDTDDSDPPRTRCTLIKRSSDGDKRRAFTKSSKKPIALMSTSSVLTRGNKKSYTLEEIGSDRELDSTKV